MAHCKVPDHILRLIDKANCPNCGAKLEFSRVSGEVEYIRLNPTGDCFPTIRDSGGDAGQWILICSNDSEHDIREHPLNYVEQQRLLDWLEEHIEPR